MKELCLAIQVYLHIKLSADEIWEPDAAQTTKLKPHKSQHTLLLAGEGSNSTTPAEGSQITSETQNHPGNLAI